MPSKSNSPEELQHTATENSSHLDLLLDLAEPQQPRRILQGTTLQELASRTFPPQTRLLGNFLHAGEFACLFGRPGLGKSLLSLDLLRSLATGEEFASQGRKDALSLLPNELPPSRVGWLDLENSDRTTKSRLRPNEPESILRYTLTGEDLEEGEEFVVRLFGELRERTQEEGFVLWVLDNLSELTGEHAGAEQQQVAALIVKEAKRFVKEAGCAFVIVAHAIKDQTGTIDLHHLQGSAKFGRSFESVFAIGGPIDGVNKEGKQVRYLKQVKTRNSNKLPRVLGLEIVQGEDGSLAFERREGHDCPELEWLHQHEPKKTSLRSDLSEKDREILEHLQEGKTGAEIVQELGVHRVEVTRARRREATRRLQEGEEVEVVARELGLSEKDLEQLTKQPRLL